MVGHLIVEGASQAAAGGVVIDLATHRVSRDGSDVHLTRTEEMLLEAMTEHPGKLLTHRWLLEHVWGAEYQQDIEVLRVFVSQLRKKVEPDVTRPKVIVMDPGIGYRWTAKRSGRRVSRTTAERSWSTPGWSRSFVACTSLVDRHEALVSGVSLDTMEGVASLIPWVSLSGNIR